MLLRRIEEEGGKAESGGEMRELCMDVNENSGGKKDNIRVGVFTLKWAIYIPSTLGFL